MTKHEYVNYRVEEMSIAEAKKMNEWEYAGIAAECWERVNRLAEDPETRDLILSEVEYPENELNDWEIRNYPEPFETEESDEFNMDMFRENIRERKISFYY